MFLLRKRMVNFETRVYSNEETTQVGELDLLLQGSGNERAALKQQLEEKNIPPEQVEKIAPMIYNFQREMALWQRGLSYVTTLCLGRHLSAGENFTSKWSNLANLIQTKKNQAAEYIATPLMIIGEQKAGGKDIDWVKQTESFFDEKRESLGIDKMMNNFDRVLQGHGILNIDRTIFKKLKTVYRFLQGLDKTEQREEEWEKKENQLQGMIYDDMSSIWGGLINTGKYARMHAYTFEKELGEKMLNDEAIRDKLVVPALFLRYVPGDKGKITSNIIRGTGNNGVNFPVRLDVINSRHIKKPKIRVTTTIRKSKNKPESRKMKMPESDIGSYDQSVESFEYIKVKDGIYCIKDTLTIESTDDEIAKKKLFPPYLIDKEITEKNPESKEYADKIVDTQRAYVGETILHSKTEDSVSLSSLNELEEETLEYNKFPDELVQLSASKIYTETIKSLHKGLHPLNNETLSNVADRESCFTQIDGVILGKKVNETVLEYCKIYNIDVPDEAQMPEIVDIYKSMMIKIRYEEPLNTMVLNAKKMEEQIEERSKEAILTSALLNNIPEKYWDSLGELLETGENMQSLLEGTQVNFMINTDKNILAGREEAITGEKISLIYDPNKNIFHIKHDEKEQTIALSDRQSIASKTVRQQASYIAKRSAHVMLREVADAFSPQLLGNRPDSFVYEEGHRGKEENIIEENKQEYPHRELYTELVGTGEWNMDIHDRGTSMDIAKQLVLDIGLIAVSGGVAGQIVKGLLMRAAKIRLALSGAGKMNLLRRSAVMRDLLRGGEAYTVALQQSRGLRYLERTMQGVVFHPVIETLEPLISGNGWSGKISRIASFKALTHSVLTMHLLGGLGVAFSPFTKIPLKEAFKNGTKNGIKVIGANAFHISTEVTGLLGLNHGLEIVRPESLDIIKTDENGEQSITQEGLHTLATIIGLRIAHMPASRNKKGTTKEKMELTNEGVVKLEIKEGDQTYIFEIKGDEIIPKTQKDQEYREKRTKANRKRQKKRDKKEKPLERDRELTQDIAKDRGKREKEHQELADNLNPEKTPDSIREEKIGLVIDSVCAEKGVELKPKEREDIIEAAMNAHEVPMEYTDKFISEKHGLYKITTSCIKKKLHELNKGLDKAGSLNQKTDLKDNIKKELIEKGLCGGKENLKQIQWKQEAIQRIIDEHPQELGFLDGLGLKEISEIQEALYRRRKNALTEKLVAPGEKNASDAIDRKGIDAVLEVKGDAVSPDFKMREGIRRGKKFDGGDRGTITKFNKADVIRVKVIEKSNDSVVLLDSYGKRLTVPSKDGKIKTKENGELGMEGKIEDLKAGDHYYIYIGKKNGENGLMGGNTLTYYQKNGKKYVIRPVLTQYGRSGSSASFTESGKGSFESFDTRMKEQEGLLLLIVEGTRGFRDIDFSNRPIDTVKKVCKKIEPPDGKEYTVKYFPNAAESGFVSMGVNPITISIKNKKTGEIESQIHIQPKELSSFTLK